MPDHDLTATALPEKPVLTLENEPTPTAPANPEASLAENIWKAGEKVFDKFSVPFKRGRGRPRKDGAPKANDVVEQVPLAPVAVVAPAVNPAYNGLFSRAIASAVRGVLGFAKSLVRKKAGQAGMDEKFTDKALAECEVEPQVMADWTEATGLLMEKYRCNTEYAPEIAWCIASARMAAPFALLLKTFDDEIKRKKSIEGSAK